MNIPVLHSLFSCIIAPSLVKHLQHKLYLQLSSFFRYYTTEVKLPQRLRPECMERPHSLKACVIRALFHMYPPFIERVRSSAPFDSEPHLLMSWCCVLMWHRKNRNAWDFYFKFHRDCSSSSNYSRYNNSRRPDLLEMLEDVLANSEDGCRVLQVNSRSYFNIVHPDISIVTRVAFFYLHR